MRFGNLPVDPEPRTYADIVGQADTERKAAILSRTGTP
jgi:hypothetical protein